jgi:hypothetical protein
MIIHQAMEEVEERKKKRKCVCNLASFAIQYHYHRVVD